LKEIKNSGNSQNNDKYTKGSEQIILVTISNSVKKLRKNFVSQKGGACSQNLETKDTGEKYGIEFKNQT